MALDTKYRPTRFEDVIGQENTVRVLREFVRRGTGFHQSYLFYGGHGSGKTTLGRILARALLCESPQDGNPCDACVSCRSILDRGSSECFIEVDAATNSGKDDVRRIVETLQYDTFSGKRRIYLFDESHRLSKDALDALLKPMEDTAPGSDDKLLICIFCTTEPERMRMTILSRCAPAFGIRRVTPEGIADRLAYVCQQEDIAYERQALVLIAEAVECHIRDALKAVEGVANLGGVTADNVRSYLRLNANPLYLKVLAFLGFDLPRVIATATELQQIVSPAVAYERLAEAAMLAYRTNLGVGKPPSYWPANQVAKLGQVQGEHLLRFAETFASRPSHPTPAMLECDLARLHHMRRGEWGPVVQVVQTSVLTAAAPAPQPPTATPATGNEEDTPSPGDAERVVESLGRVTAAAPTERNANQPSRSSPEPELERPIVTSGGVYVDPRGVKKRNTSESRLSDGSLPPLDPAEFRRNLRRFVAELSVDGRRGGQA